MQSHLSATLGWVKANPSAVLLGAQLLGIVLYAFVDEAGVGSVARLLVSLFGMVVVALALAVLRESPIYTWLGVLIGIPAVVLTFVEWASADPAWSLASNLMHVAFYAYTLIGLLSYMFADDQVTSDEVWSIGATFTVAVWLWAYTYASIQFLVPGSFTAAVNSDSPRTWLELLFLSTTTMTSTGLSDVVPIKPLARSAVMIQQIAGMLYLAVVVARIVGLTLNRSRRQS